MDLKVALKRFLTACVTTSILSTTMVLAKDKPRTAPITNIPAALSPESARPSNLKAENTGGPVAGPATDMAAIKSPAELRAAVKKALTNKTVAARVRAELGRVNYRLLRRALDDPKEPAVETQAASAWACWFACLRSAGVSLYTALACAATCAVGALPACLICAVIGGGVATFCAQLCAHTVIGEDGGSDKGEILN